MQMQRARGEEETVKRDEGRLKRRRTQKPEGARYVQFACVFGALLSRVFVLPILFFLFVLFEKVVSSSNSTQRLTLSLIAWLTSRKSTKSTCG